MLDRYRAHRERNAIPVLPQRRAWPEWLYWLLMMVPVAVAVGLALGEGLWLAALFFVPALAFYYFVLRRTRPQ